MSVIGRLWRRAPAWRLCLVTAVACTGLAAMFPPTLPRLPSLRAGGTSSDAGAASYRPQATRPVSDQGLLHMPPPGSDRQGIIPYAGRLVPLPAGTWHELAIAKGGGAEQQQVLLLDRIENSHLSGLLLVAAPGPLSGAAGTIGLPPLCADPGRLVGHITPALPGQSPLVHECWAITPVDMQDMAAHSTDEILKRGLARLGEMHVAVPDHMLAVSFVRSSETGWQIATIMLPDRHVTPHATELWATRFAGPMHQGFDGRLSQTDLPPAVARDPT